MTHYFIKPDEWDRSDILLSGAESRHLLTVLRTKPGARIRIFDGTGRTGCAELTGVTKRQAKIRILADTCRIAPESKPFITLAQAVPKLPAMDGIIQKAVELGISSVIPVLSERVILRPDAKSLKNRLARWRKIGLEAAKQCGSARVPEIQPLVALHEFAARLSEHEKSLVASLQPGAAPLREAVKELAASDFTSLTCIIGPEGDFTNEEYAELCNAGAIPVSLGPLVLRVETAAMYMMSVLNCEFRHT